MIIHDKGFDKRMIDALNNNKFSSVSGRLCHSWFDLIGPKKKFINILKLKSPISLILFGTGAVGYSNFDNNSFSKSFILGEVYESDTNCRGPWLINKYLLNKIGPLDTDKFFLGYDDHDFNLRGSELGFRSGYTPVIMSCDKNNSSSFQVKTNKNKEIYDYLFKNKSISSFKRIFGYNELLYKIKNQTATKPKKI
jgi:GT2 family glycosyltransferase